MRVLLDTAAFLWSVESPELLSSVAATVIRDSSIRLELSTLSLSEIAIKRAKGNLDFHWDDVQSSALELGILFLAYEQRHAEKLFEIPAHHKDPFDRQIIAQALAEDIPVITSDRWFRRYEGLTVIW